MSEIRNLIQKCIDQADEIEKLKEDRDSWRLVASTLELEKLELREQLRQNKIEKKTSALLWDKKIQECEGLREQLASVTKDYRDLHQAEIGGVFWMDELEGKD
jgi:SMC interacting uncharacterized protein involved in chromosome segregation